MCHIEPKSWVDYVGTWMVLVKTDNTAYPALSWDVAIRNKKLIFHTGAHLALPSWKARVTVPCYT